LRSAGTRNCKQYFLLDSGTVTSYYPNQMTAYRTTNIRPLPEAVREARERRKLVLESAEQTRRANYQRFLQRMASIQKTLRAKNRRLQASSGML
jgi:hypothetical protein